MEDKHLEGQLIAVAATLALILRKGEPGLLEAIKEARDKFRTVLSESKSPRPIDRGISDMIERIAHFAENKRKTLESDTSNFGYDARSEGQ